MTLETLFISDLHLSAAKPNNTQRFLSFLETRAQGSQRLYILGDLFDAYIGDDDNSSPNREIKTALKKLSLQGTAVYFQQGNRDFLVSQQFCNDTGVELLGDYAVIDLYGEAALLTHGDLLCTDDTAYQAARCRVRAESWKHNALSKPLLIRQLYARWYRFKSGLDKSKKNLDIMDANPQAIAHVMNQYHVQLLIHGHTHRPAIHDLEINDKPARRFVLAEWNDTGQVLCWQGKGRWAIETIA